VTGLVTVPTVSTWSFFGQAVILFLIQIGGIGIITVMAGLASIIHKKMSIRDNQLIQDAFNLNSLSGLTKFVKQVIFGTLTVEAIGALLSMIVFIPDFGVKGIWISVFHSISSFCNAGIDIFSETSLCAYATNPLLNTVTCALIVLGGLGYIVWWDLLRVLKDVKKLKWKCFSRLTLHSKIVLSATLILILGGAALIFLFEYNNPLTIGNASLFDKIQISLFQSITTRTAGFATVPQEHLTTASAIVCLLLMFIGGSPIGTAGGVKTVTMVVLFATGFAMVRNKNEITLFQRRLSSGVVRKAIAVTTMSFLILFVSTVALSAVTQADALDIFYETASATATVGLTRNVTSMLGLWGKVIVIFTMYFGRVGPISLALAFASKKEKTNVIKNPIEEISVG